MSEIKSADLQEKGTQFYALLVSSFLEDRIRMFSISTMVENAIAK
jgi:hypothetical protein